MLPIWQLVAVQDPPRLRHRGGTILRRTLRDATNPFEISDHLFIQYYRMPKHLALILVDKIKDVLRSRIRGGVPPVLQVLIALRFYAEGGYQKGVGQDMYHPISQAMVSRIIHRVTDALTGLSEEYIRFPNTVAKRRLVESGFRALILFPGVIGAIDCTHVAIRRPVDHEESYINYKGYHSLNVQMIGDTAFNILNIRICPGATNDRSIWRYSQIKDYIENLRSNQRVTQNECKYFLIGDGGYTLSPILLTPILNPANGSPEAAFTTALVHTRVKIEQLFGILKQRWRCLTKDRILHYDPVTAGNIVRACGVLHNFVNQHRYPLHSLNNTIEDDRDEEEFQELDARRCEREYAMGLRERQIIVDRYFQ